MIEERNNETNKEGKDALDRLLHYAENSELQENSENSEKEEKIPGGVKNPHLTSKELYANLFIFFLAGHDTTAAALSWGVGYLAKYPEEQQKLYDQIYSVLGDKPPTIEDLDKFPYLDQFIFEILRMHPPVGDLTTRKANSDITYNPPDGGKTVIIPKGSIVGIDINTIHHSPKYWEEPYKFNPSRFDPAKKKKHKFQFLPFSLGPRECIGTKFSLIEQHLFLIRLLQLFKVELPENEPFSMKTTPGVQKPVRLVVKLKKRN